MSRERQTQRLRAIKDLKSEKYITTNEALQYLRHLEALHEQPRKITDAINSTLTQEESIVYYPATPENLLGTLKVLQEAWYDANLLICPESNVQRRDFFNLKDTIACAGPGNVIFQPVCDAAHAFVWFFKDLQHEEARHGSLAHAITSYLHTQYNIQPLRWSHLEAHIANTDWEYACSQEHLREIEAHERNKLYHKKIGLRKQITRMMCDDVRDRLKSTREQHKIEENLLTRNTLDALIAYQEQYTNTYMRGILTDYCETIAVRGTIAYETIKQ